nr:MAG TPA: hypothetical protein [Caudoviricetes sp.]
MRRSTFYNKGKNTWSHYVGLTYSLFTFCNGSAMN